MMAISNDLNKMNVIANFIWLDLQKLGYRKSKRVFNRIKPDGIVHVIDFQMGKSWNTLRGKFTVEIGIFFPEIYKAFWCKPLPKFITSPWCEERIRLGNLGKRKTDIWWDLSGDVIAIEREVRDLLLINCEQYFSQFGSREKLLAEWNQEKLKKNLTERKTLMMAIILAHQGNKMVANELLKTEFGDKYKTDFLEYAQNIATSAGLDFPLLK